MRILLSLFFVGVLSVSTMSAEAQFSRNESAQLRGGVENHAVVVEKVKAKKKKKKKAVQKPVRMN